ncbi:MAG: SUMF1/EgtB/PvdO family nonheme iron enzyme [Candidatus Aureabacteria bacterium]|nr:SUMF1/EgtB/PvdO family nonheme iron enzyme [Candidatus Auribacterota bacterium]
MKRSLVVLVVILAALFYFQDSYAQLGAWSGITRSGSSGSYTYSVIPGRENRPVCWVNWYDAARFCNWLHNGKGNGDTEKGAYNFASGDSNDPRGYDDDLTNDPVAHESGALFWIPTANEWYKAAYYSPAKTYYDYPTGSNTEPIAEPPPGGQNSANFLHEDPPMYDPPGTEDVGSYINAPSPYGTYDQSGNVSELIEDKGNEGTRTTVGCGWSSGCAGDANGFWEDWPEGGNPSRGSENSGFRVASSTGVSPAATATTAWTMLKNSSPRAGLSAVEGSHSVTPVALTWVAIGNGGNPNDDPGYSGEGFGGVDYDYYIGQYEITYSQYCEFLNAVAATDSHSLFNGNMGTTVTPNYINLAVTPATVVPGGPVTLAYACDFTTWPYQGVSVTQGRSRSRRSATPRSRPFIQPVPLGCVRPRVQASRATTSSRPPSSTRGMDSSAPTFRWRTQTSSRFSE